MKKSELKEYIREAIIAELTPQDKAAGVAAKAAIDDTVKDLSVKANQTTDVEDKKASLAALTAAKTKQALINKAISTGQAVSADLLPEGEDDDDSSVYDKEPTKADLKKEKIKGAPSKFKISDEKYKELKSRLKTVVEKVKDLDKKIKDPNTKKSELDDLKDQKLKKMEALKKFIKNDELVKAFKERDVKIDTDGLIG